MTIEINPLTLQKEAYRLGELGVLDITWRRDDGAVKTGKYVVVGYGVDGDENDCLMVAGPYGMTGKNVHRFLVVSSIQTIAVSETQSFNRYGTPVMKRSVGPPYQLSKQDLEFLNDLGNGNATPR